MRAAGKAFTRRTGDISQRIRTAVQFAFMGITLLVGAQFYLWVRYYETGGTTWKVSRPPGVEAWLPIASLMNTKALLLTGEGPPHHAAGMFMLLAFLAISFLLRKAFCSWICPIGTISEGLWQLGQSLFGRAFLLPKWLDIPLRGIKYILLALFLYVVVSMPVHAIREFLSTPYGLIADVKMLDFFRLMGRATAITLIVLLVGSVFVKNFWCRLMCPYGALMGLAGWLGPARIRRDPDACIDCAKCAKACPAGLPVDTALSIRSAECTACLSCVHACPAAGALDLRIGTRRRTRVLQPAAVAAVILAIFLGIVGYARITGQWHTHLPDAMYFELIPNARQFAHPR
ncbi:MAG TPA: 4Fe-4S binding protein [Vicinamibacterales bacterium]|nr:4Fe-4S binding protein [Vicinamibacterales bacterium]